MPGASGLPSDRRKIHDTDIPLYRAAAATETAPVARQSRFPIRSVFSTTRQTFYAVFFILWFAIDVSLLGLVSQQIHKYGQEQSNYPSGKYQHALGLLLFSTLIGLLFSIFHWALGLTVYLPVFLAFGVWFGTGAGILEETPFGHGLQCKHINDPSKFAPNWVPFLQECSRVTAISGLAWAMFALATIGFFWTIADKFSFVSKRSVVYESLAEQGEQIPEKH
ncbi:hypothetical protein CI109_102173 [Kwoniella shandongensis]|uniref:Uncharacterized protein n=1 Tax=Kwoniella shandongensis TaxID=1734106 RepID=A0A5M6BZ66_9TREE|nr:uncharacterized protein CI109_003668 [Kwoniella shandongensis]KAA5528013.1 hypothetical protein CI109_003668 [Kwoniella shandongensis]